MKKETTIEVIPQTEVEHTVYICDSCGSSSYDSSIYFSPCCACGKETCPDCRQILPLFDTKKGPIIEVNEFGDLACREKYIDLADSTVFICNDCYNKLPQNHQEIYLEHVKEVIANFNKKLEELNNVYKKGEFYWCANCGSSEKSAYYKYFGYDRNIHLCERCNSSRKGIKMVQTLKRLMQVEIERDKLKAYLDKHIKKEPNNGNK